MSLIREALEKARHDAARVGEAPQPELYRPLVQSPKRSALPWVVTAISVGLAAGVLIGVFGVGRPGPEAATPIALVEPTRSVASLAPASTDTDAGSAAEATAPALPDATETAAERPPAAVAPPPATAGPDSTAPDPAPAVVPSPPLESPVAPPPATVVEPPPPAAAESSHRQADPRPGASYRRRVALPDGDEIALGGIAWSEVGPSALVNGKVLGVGEGTADWTVVGIDRQEVEVEWNGVRFSLRLK